MSENCGDRTFLRLTWFMHDFSEGQHGAAIRDEDAIYSAAGTGRVSFVSADDVAGAAFAVLMAPAALDGDSILTSDEPPSYEHLPMDQAIAACAEKRTTYAVAYLTGKSPMTFEAFAADDVGAWKHVA